MRLNIKMGRFLSGAFYHGMVVHTESLEATSGSLPWYFEEDYFYDLAEVESCWLFLGLWRFLEWAEIFPTFYS